MITGMRLFLVFSHLESPETPGREDQEGKKEEKFHCSLSETIYLDNSEDPASPQFDQQEDAEHQPGQLQREFHHGGVDQNIQGRLEILAWEGRVRLK